MRARRRLPGAATAACFCSAACSPLALTFGPACCATPPKPQGFRQIIEGSLTPDRPVFLVDDVLSSGRSAAAAMTLLRQHGFPIAGLAVVFRYGWRSGRERLKDYGVSIHALAALYPNPS